MPHTISIVLCTHNGATFLPDLLESLAAQTAAPYEIVISDDASTDGTRAILESFAASSTIPVRLTFNAVALGYRENFLSAAGQATGEWVAFCDQDDVWEPRKLAECERVMSTDGLTQILHSSVLIDDKGTEIGTFAQGIQESVVRPPLYYNAWRSHDGFAMVVRRDLFDVVDADERFAPHEEATETKLAHDRWAFFLAHTMGRTAEIAQPLVRYRQHANNLYGSAAVPWWKKLRPESQEGERTAQRRVLEEARAMLHLVGQLPENLTETFPAFDRVAAADYYSRVLRQAADRAAAYDLSRLRGVGAVVRGAREDVYSTGDAGRRNWKSVGKDLAYFSATPKR